MVILILTTLTLRFILHTSLLTSLPGLHWHSAFLRMRVNRFLRYLLVLWLWQVPRSAQAATDPDPMRRNPLCRPDEVEIVRLPTLVASSVCGEHNTWQVLR